MIILFYAIQRSAISAPKSENMTMSSAHYKNALKQIRSICGRLPEMAEVKAWGHPTFRAGKKMFAAIGEGEEGVSVGLKVGFERQEELLQDDRFFPTPYAARQGWVSLRIEDPMDWDEVAGLLLEAYRQVALKRMLTELDRQA
jgi:predicted DNA-binding protein (MmcQ/YjbR family)